MDTPSQPPFSVEASLAQLFQTAGEFELTGRDPLGEEMRTFNLIRCRHHPDGQAYCAGGSL